MTSLKAHTVLESIAEILSDGSNGNFSVIGYKDVNTSEDESIVPIVSVAIKSGEFETDNSGIFGPFPHIVEVEITIIASSSSTADLSVLENIESTQLEISTAISAMKSASRNAECLVHSVIGDIYNILNGVNNYELGQDTGEIKQRSLLSYKISEDVVSGDYVTRIGTMKFVFTVDEEITGIAGESVVDPMLDGGIQIYSDDDSSDSQKMDCDVIDP